MKIFKLLFLTDKLVRVTRSRIHDYAPYFAFTYLLMLCGVWLRSLTISSFIFFHIILLSTNSKYLIYFNSCWFVFHHILFFVIFRHILWHSAVCRDYHFQWYFRKLNRSIFSLSFFHYTGNSCFFYSFSVSQSFWDFVILMRNNCFCFPSAYYPETILLLLLLLHRLSYGQHSTWQC